MNSFSKLASLSLAALALTTSIAFAFPVIDVTPQVSPPANVSSAINDAVLGSPNLNNSNVNDVILGQESASPASRDVITVRTLKCAVSGSPSEFPDDLLVINTGNAIPAGTKLKWQVKSYGLQGTVQLNTALPSGDHVRLLNVLGSGVEAGIACTAKAV